MINVAPDKNYLPHQVEGIRYMINKRYALNGDEMRLGKTIQTAGLINNSPDVMNAIIICPAHLVIDWKRKLEEWLLFPFKIEIAQGEVFPKADIVIVSYHKLTDIQHYEEEGRKKTKRIHKYPQIRKTEWDLLVVDEAHYMKDPQALRTRYILGQGRGGIKANRKIFLTGSPMPNRPIDLWPLIHALAPRCFPSKHEFALRYCGAVKEKFGWNYKGASNRDELNEKLLDCVMIRRTLAEVKEDYKAPVREVVILNPEDYSSDLLLGEWQFTKKNPTWKQAVLDLNVDTMPGFHEFTEVRHATALVKIPDVISHLDSAIESSGKVICFAHHHDVIEGIAEGFRGQCVTYYGKNTDKEKQAAEHRFREDPNCKLFIGNIIAAGTGLDLSVSSHIVFAELDWVPGNMIQDEKRGESLFKDEPLFVQHLVIDGSMDAYIAQTIVYKQNNIDAVVEGR